MEFVPEEEETKGLMPDEDEPLKHEIVIFDKDD
jgi:hypothetical protein